MKLYKKSNLKCKNGYLVTDKKKVIGIDPSVVYQANALETMAQKVAWLEAQPKPCDGPDWSKFDRVHSGHKVKLHTKTPILDKKIEESLALAKEIDHYTYTEEAEAIIGNKFNDLVQFVSSNKVMNSSQYPLQKFDTPTLGNPLDWDLETIIRVVIDSITNGLIEA